MLPFFDSINQYFIGVSVKSFSFVILLFSVLPSMVMANEDNYSLDSYSLDSYPLDNIKVYNTESSTLSIQNFSHEVIEFEIYGEAFSLSPASGMKYNCLSYDQLAIKVINNDHSYFEVACNAKLVFENLFTNQYASEK